MQAQSIHIIYTDDDVDDQELFRGALSEVDSSLILTTIGDGDQLFSLLASNPVPRLIFLDLNMPKRDGYDVLRKLRSSEATKNYPVVVFTTTADQAAVEKTREMGANMFVPKPYTYDAMKRAIQTCVNMDWQQFANSGQSYLMRFS